ncbi:MAG: beta-galactosidase [Muribaculaceae bacterium]|nr:beta-galactosidase [Muribaculaceae bacterium]
MKINGYHAALSVVVTLLLLSACGQSKTKTEAETPADFVTVKDGQFYIGDSVYKYVGTNFWYGAILASEGRGGDRARLAKELDLLQSIGIDNLRVLVGGDGDEGIPSHIEPVLQTAPGVYNDTILDGLDYLMAELERRDMKAVLFLNNAWEWSGGYGSYLQWAGEGKAPVPSVDSWPAYMNYVSRFVTNDSAKAMALNHVKNIVSRTNRYTGKPYSESPAIMSWQVANEPRVFSEDPEAKRAFSEWIHETARTIKAIDPNHLVSTGSEGRHGCEQDMDLWNEIHSFPEIDYGIVHLWPYNWSWVHKETLTDSVGQACEFTSQYIRPHYELMAKIGKPLVLEEFGYPRDGFVFTPGSPTTGRDEFYRYVFNMIAESGMIAGCNFWGWGGYAEPQHEMWERWDPYVCDPAQEEQGLNSVFAADSTTLAIISEMTQKITR